jgi:RNA polymerase sigma factor (sigma-70 family)
LTTAEPSRIDPAIVTGLYERHAPELRLFLLGVLRNADLASEALQNTFAKALESAHTANPESLKAWLFQVAFHEALLLRRRGLVHDRSLRHLAAAARQLEPGNSGDCPADRMARSELVEQLRRALEDLPVDQRRVVRMRIYEEKSFAAIADELAAPLGTVLTRMRLAVKKLSQRLRSSHDPH